jgi:endo-1,4-beta-xylanase
MRESSLRVTQFLRCGVLAVLLFSSIAKAAIAEAAGVGHQEIPLWPTGAPGSEGKTAKEAVRLTPDGEHIVSSVHHPSITPYFPSKGEATGAAVIVVPGGGHRELWMDHEGYNVAKWLSSHGVAAFILKYRLAREEGSSYTVEGNSLADLKRAIRLVRSRASEWGLDSERIGVMGFSAGGELAALASTRYDIGTEGATDPIERQSSRPAFQALLYPAIPRDMSLTKQTPPAFLACGADDRQEISQGLPELYLALKRADVPAELHVYAGVGHGFGVRNSNRGSVSAWIQLFRDWLDVQGFTGHK